MSLIEALRLNKGEQQDAAEFSKLFLEMITNELLKQKDLKLRSLTRDLVCLWILELADGSSKEYSDIRLDVIVDTPVSAIPHSSNSN